MDVDPRSKCTPEQIEEMRLLYVASFTPARDIARRFNISQERLYAIRRLENWPLRGKAFAITGARRRLGKKRTIGSVFCGMAKDNLPKVDSEALELAKTALRKRGMVVFNATVDGSGPKGIVKCDGQLFTAEQIIQRAAQ